MTSRWPDTRARRRGRALIGLALAAISLSILLLVGSAQGERTQRGDLIVVLNGTVAPRDLPRSRPAPVSFKVEGEVATAGDSRLPRLTEIRLALGGRGYLSNRGLPVCPRRLIRTADTRQALARCRGALVGRGKLVAQIVLPRQSPFRLASRLLAFNGRTKRGRPAVWVHAFAGSPPISIVLPFVVRRQAATLRTSLTLAVPRSVGPWPRLARFEITFFRRYRHRGRLRSYLSAACPIPRRFTAGFLAFARANYVFADGRHLDVESVRSCRAR